MRVLIIEDDRPLAEALVAKCTAEGLEPTHAPDGAKGLALALSEHPDLILLDIIMPHMSGLEFLHELRKDSWGARVPVIIMTNLPADSKDLITAVVEGAPEYYLVKSDWKIEDIVHKVQEVLAKHPSNAVS